MLTNKYNANRVAGVRSATGYLPLSGGTTGARRLPFFLRRGGWRRVQRGRCQAPRFDDLPPEREREARGDSPTQGIATRARRGGFDERRNQGAISRAGNKQISVGLFI